MHIKITGKLLSIAILLITGRAQAIWLQADPARISIGIGRFFLRLIKGLNFQINNVVGFSPNWNTAALLLPTGDANLKTSPVSADLTGNNISGSGLINNIPACIQTPISKHVVSIQVSLMSSVLPAKTVRLVRQWSNGQRITNFIYSNNLQRVI